MPRGTGGTTAAKRNQQSIDRNRRSATWFARNRRGGRVILYHRHLGPVLIRDWSTPADLFTATVAASADTQQSRDTAVDHMTAEFVRPLLAQSNYLDTAVSPAPWPSRPTRSQQHGGRPMLDAERRLAGSKRAAALTRAAVRPL